MFLFVSDVFKPLNDLASVFPQIYFDKILWNSITLSSVNFLIRSSSFWVGFSQRALRLLKKCGLWSFKVIKQLFLPFTNHRLFISFFSIIFFPSALTLLPILSGIFFFVDVIASVVTLLYLSVSIWYIFDVLSATTKIFFDFLKAQR